LVQVRYSFGRECWYRCDTVLVGSVGTGAIQFDPRHKPDKTKYLTFKLIMEKSF
jgi:hypothetical protein